MIQETPKGASDEDFVFLEWLRENGAVVENIEWPSRETVASERGAVALKDFQPGEPMLEIPERIMITPARCRDCPELRDVYAAHADYFAVDDDRTLTLYLMHEKSRGTESFWHPYFAILPDPGSISDWETHELLELQDRSLVGEARRRPMRIKLEYEALMVLLETKFPTKFPRNRYSFELYRWSWMTIQARAFGRRLPFGALVPFADCLNHTNVATKYELTPLKKDGGTRVFRLFPSGKTSYKKGCEVFNSYGRRTNRFLLLEYGFALESNEWDSVDVYTHIEEKDVNVANYSEKYKLLHMFGQSTFHVTRLNLRSVSQDLVQFLRLKHLNQEEVEECKKMAAIAAGAVNMQQCGWKRMISPRNELEAFVDMRNMLLRSMQEYPTSVEQDSKLLAELSPSDDFRRVCAIRYRLCRKRILQTHIDLAASIIPVLEFKMKTASDTSLTAFASSAMKHFINPLSGKPAQMHSTSTIAEPVHDLIAKLKLGVGTNNIAKMDSLNPHSSRVFSESKDAVESMSLESAKQDSDSFGLINRQKNSMETT